MLSRAAVRLRAWREFKGLSQSAVCDELDGLDQAVYSKWERGIRTPTRSQAVLVERVTGVAVEEWDEPAARVRKAG